MTPASPTHQRLRIAICASLLVMVLAQPAFAYIGPGAGIAVLGSFMVFFLAALSAIFTLLTWPVRWLIRSIRGQKAFANARVKRVVVLGLDGLDPELCEKYMAEGRLPNFERLKAMGNYQRLGTTLPAMTPVAWSSFLTGCNPGKHNIFDFLTVDRKTYLPMLSSVHIGGSSRSIRIGKYIIPLGKPDIRLLRKGKPFWNTLGEHGIASNIIRMPITFPPERFRGTLLSSMCVPDLRGTQGTFSYYTTRSKAESIYEGGEQVRVERMGDVIESELVGPPNTMKAEGGPMRAPFKLVLKGSDAAVLHLSGEKYELKRGEYTPWLRFRFNAAPGVKVRGICQFLLINTEPEFELYVTPLQLDPENPVMPISHPRVFSTYLAKSQGPFATLGLAEDTWAHNEKILTDPGFLHQCVEADEEREIMFFDTLSKTRRGLVACVFDSSDRIQHMFWRYLDPKHPAREGFGDTQLRDAIPEMFERMDRLVGKTLDEVSKDAGTVLFVVSDHGCKSFRRGIDLNRWLIDNGLMVLKEPPKGRKYLATVDWSKTKAYAVGLSGIYLNVKDREAQGIVAEGAEADAVRQEISEKLTGLRDEEHNEVAVNKAFIAKEVYHGPYVDGAPDILVGYNDGYRVSWEAAIGDVTDATFADNVKAWSGDHCIDPRTVPGIMFCNRRLEVEKPRLMDLGPTILRLFGVDVPKNMDGRPFEVADAPNATVAPPAQETTPAAAPAA